MGLYKAEALRKVRQLFSLSMRSGRECFAKTATYERCRVTTPTRVRRVIAVAVFTRTASFVTEWAMTDLVLLGAWTVMVFVAGVAFGMERDE